jgi:hypothetical protein
VAGRPAEIYPHAVGRSLGVQRHRPHKERGLGLYRHSDPESTANHLGWGGGNRTPIRRAKTCCPTFERRPIGSGNLSEERRPAQPDERTTASVRRSRMRRGVASQA